MLTRGARQRRILHGLPRFILFSGICLALLTAVGYFTGERARLQSAKETAAHILGDSLALVSTELLSSNKQSAAQSYLDRVAAHSFVESASLYSQNAPAVSGAAQIRRGAGVDALYVVELGRIHLSAAAEGRLSTASGKRSSTTSR